MKNSGENTHSDHNRDGKIIIPRRMLKLYGGSFTANEVIFYMEIKDRSTKCVGGDGYCYTNTTNGDFAREFNTSTRTIIRYIQKLQQEGYITITLEKNNYRKIYFT